jgi:hypothetical protein
MTEVTVQQILDDLEITKEYDYQRNNGKLRRITVQNVTISENQGARVIFSPVDNPETNMEVFVTDKNETSNIHHFYHIGAQAPPSWGAKRKRTSRKKMPKRIGRRRTRKY